MLLYHGTTAAVAEKALQEGLKPRKHHGKSNWEHTSESRPDCVYLTNCYAGYYAACASAKEKTWGFIEVDTDRLDEKRFLPDEDFIEGAIRESKNKSWKFLEALDFNDRLAFLRDCLPEYSNLWEDSIRYLGNCCYRGTIPPEAITRITLFDKKTNPTISLMCLDPTITLLNFKICGEKYKAMTRWFAGYQATAEELNHPFPFLNDEQREAMEECVANQGGVRVIFDRQEAMAIAG